MVLSDYQKLIENRFNIIDKENNEIPFKLNPPQIDMLHKASNRNVILKARQLGFSSLILAMFTADFLFRENSYSVVVADNSDNSIDLLERVKLFIRSFEENNNIKIPLKYNSKYELYNEFNGARYKIGSAENREFGRSKTITNLHLSEFAFYPDPESMLASALQALIPTGKVFIETTANGFNFFKEFWDECVAGERRFTHLFYPPTWEYSKEYLENKQRDLDRLFKQEYPMTPEEAFLTSGDCYFNLQSLGDYNNQVQKPMESDVIYV